MDGCGLSFPSSYLHPLRFGATRGSRREQVVAVREDFEADGTQVNFFFIARHYTLEVKIP